MATTTETTTTKKKRLPALEKSKLSPEQERYVRACAEIANALVDDYDSTQQTGSQEGGKKRDINLNALRSQIAKKLFLSRQPPLTDIIAAVPEQYKKYILPKLIAKPIRSASGIAVVAVMCKPHRCPHIAYTGNICVYCPGGPDSDFEYSTQSYTGYEPTSMRAIRARYDPFEQARGRVDQIRNLGHSVDKVEYIIMGGTFMSLSPKYREEFISQLHNALSGYQTNDVDEAVMAGEQSTTKCIGITIETRPRLLPPAPLNRHATLRLHTPRNRRAKPLRRRRARHEPRPHRRRRGRNVLPRKGRRLQGGLTHDARLTQRRPRTRPVPIPRVLRQSGLPHRRVKNLPDPRDPRPPGSTSSGARGVIKITPPTRSSTSSRGFWRLYRPGRASTASSAISPCPSSRAEWRMATSANWR